MQIVIEIPENEVPDCQEIISMNLHFIHKEVCECTYPFIVLPEHHGRLIDADTLEECKEIMNTIMGECKYVVRMDDIRNVPPIIPATKGEIHCYYTTEEIAKSFIEDVSAVKDQLPKQTATKEGE